jgi:hypothetical protein
MTKVLSQLPAELRKTLNRDVFEETSEAEKIDKVFEITYKIIPQLYKYADSSMMKLLIYFKNFVDRLYIKLIKTEY